MQADLTPRLFSIKHVVSGTESYCLNGQRFEVGAGEYLLSSRFSEGFVEIDSPRAPVRGICIELAPSLLAEAVSSFRQPGATEADPGLDLFFDSPDFLENQYPAARTRLGRLLENLDWGAEAPLPDGLLLDMAEALVDDHRPIFRQLREVKTVKTATRKHLFRRIEQGRSFIDAHFAEPLDVAAVARAAQVSEFHFQTVQKIHGRSPHRYLTEKRLEHARFLLEKKGVPVGEVASRTGFADGASFSKAFKRWAGAAPSRVRS